MSLKTIRLVSSQEAITLYINWIRERKSGPCVVCDQSTFTQFINRETGCLDYVHNYHEPEYIGCKEVWRYWQDRPYKTTREKLAHLAKDGDEMAADMLSWAGEDEILDERDYYTPGNYQEYIQSREWKIKATAAKRSVRFRCEECGAPGDSRNLHAHHLTYKRLFREQRQDIQILCPTCHEQETERRRKRRNGQK